MALAACLVFLSENGLLPSEALDADAWERLTLDVAASRLDRTETAGRLRTLLVQTRYVPPRDRRPRHRKKPRFGCGLADILRSQSQVC